jgi:hypothetical protein
MAIRGERGAVVHDIRTVLDVHPNWMVLQVDVANVMRSYVGAYNHQHHHIHNT